MRCVTTIFGIALVAVVSSASAKEPQKSGELRDGSTQQRAIIVTQPESKYVHWEYVYLDEHFPGRWFPMQHALVSDDSETHMWDRHTFMWRGRKTEVWFDITRQFREFTNAHKADKKT
jgi:hypothetical protein